MTTLTNNAQREFNTRGPVFPHVHYHVDRKELRADLCARIEKGRYITLTSARQVGKTTILRETIADMEATGEYFGILLNFQKLTSVSSERFYERLGKQIDQWHFGTESWASEKVQDQFEFIDYLCRTLQIIGKRGILMIDEFDAIDVEILKPLLDQFRGMYLERFDPNAFAFHSIILVGVRNIPSLLEGTQSPFNIADSFTIPAFSLSEIKMLYQQHTEETGQEFTQALLEAVYHESEGQPFLVNRLAQLLTQEVDADPNKPIGLPDMPYALATITSENNTHTYSIVSKATPHRKLLMPMLLYNRTRTSFLDQPTQELIMYGVLRVVEAQRGLQYAKIGNPIYRKMLLLRFNEPLEPYAINGEIRNRYLIDGVLNFDGIVDNFKSFMKEHGIRLIQSKKSERPLELGGQYLLLSYLSAALDNVQGIVTLESVSTAGEIDILAFCQGQKFIIETKIWYGPAKFEEAKTQLLRYLNAAELTKGYLVVFDEKMDDNPILQEQGDLFEISVDDKVLRIYLIPVPHD
ncbi:MAG: AAA-like domain-containing protein [Chloroflexota bacterium]